MLEQCAGFLRCGFEKMLIEHYGQEAFRAHECGRRSRLSAITISSPVASRNAAEHSLARWLGVTSRIMMNPQATAGPIVFC